MLARLARELPAEGHLYEPKWDGFRCVAFREGGEVERTIDVPGADFVSSVCFGGPALDDLYVTTRTAILRTRVGVAGLRVPPARV